MADNKATALKEANTVYTDGVKYKMSEQMAKELLREYIHLSLQEPENKDMIANIELFKKTEQFLQDSEKKTE